VIKHLAEHGIETSVTFKPLDGRGEWHKKTVCLPVHEHLKISDLKRIIKLVKEVL
jgi:dTDP-4-amino-4,6-dideoxygalactose transaminase